MPSSARAEPVKRIGGTPRSVTRPGSERARGCRCGVSSSGARLTRRASHAMSKRPRSGRPPRVGPRDASILRSAQCCVGPGTCRRRSGSSTCSKAAQEGPPLRRAWPRRGTLLGLSRPAADGHHDRPCCAGQRRRFGRRRRLDPMVRVSIRLDQHVLRSFWDRPVGVQPVAGAAGRHPVRHCGQRRELRGPAAERPGLGGLTTSVISAACRS